MRVLIAGGGTAGHINPALAIAGTIMSHEPDAQILFVGNRDGLEQKLVRQAGYEIRSIKISGFSRSLSPGAMLKNAQTAFRAVGATGASRRIIKEFMPDICVGTGGYVSGPVMRSAEKLGIPVVIHEQNAYPGVTTKMLAKRAQCVMLALDAARERIETNAEIVLTGNPLRQQVLNAKKAESRAALGVDSRPLVLSFGGSMGARSINEAMAPLVARSGRDKKYQHIHAYGRYGTWFPALVRESLPDMDKCGNLDIREYIDNMDICLAASDLVICRCGAITLSEIQAQGKPSVLIPSPNVAENHQFHNAMALANARAAVVIEENELTPDKLMGQVDSLLSDETRLNQYGENARRMAITDANERIYSVIKRLYDTSHNLQTAK